MLGLTLHKPSMLSSLRVGLFYCIFCHGAFAASPIQDGLFPQYQFKQVIPVIVGLLIIAFILHALDRQLKKRVEHKFWLAEDVSKPISSRLDDFRDKKWLIIGITLFGLILVAYFFLPLLQQHQHLRFIKYSGLGLLIFSAYLLGKFMRGKQVELLINNLDQHIERKKLH